MILLLVLLLVEQSAIRVLIFIPVVCCYWCIGYTVTCAQTLPKMSIVILCQRMNRLIKVPLALYRL